jgi:hypothetical protein
MTRYHDVGQLTTAELAFTMRELRANLGLLTPDSPAHVPILAHMRAIDAELAGRAGNRHPGGGQRHDREILPGPPYEPQYPADRDSNTQGPPAGAGLEAGCGGHPPAGDTPLLENRADAAIATGRAGCAMAVSRLAENDPAWETLARVREALLRLLTDHERFKERTA